MRRSAVLGIVTMLLLAGCGGDDGEEEGASSDYCERIEAYDQATTNLDERSVESTLDGFATSAEAVRAAADVAPEEIRSEVGAMADAAEALVQRLQEDPPATQEELIQLSSTIASELESEFGDLEVQTEAVQTHASEACGLTIG